MSSEQRLTQRELARRLGLSQATVSRALSRNTRHSDATRRRIAETAESLGYRPDPVLASLNAYRRTRRPISRGQSLAWFGHSSPKEPSYEAELFAFARSRAEALGYGLDYFWEHEPGATPARFGSIFAARGIAGVIFGPRPRPRARIELDIDGLAAVALGRSVAWPRVDLVSADHFQTMEACFQGVMARGYRRIGFALTHAYNERVAGLWRGSYLNQQASHPELAALPPFQEPGFDDGGFDRWLDEWRPDAILTMDGAFGCLGALRKRRISVPRDLGLALLALPGGGAAARHAGVVEPTEHLAALAVDVVVARIRNHERGAPAERRIHLLPGVWRDRAADRHAE